MSNQNNSFLAVAAIPTAYHAGIDAVACVWTPISEHDDQQAAYDACKAFAASGQHHVPLWWCRPILSNTTALNHVYWRPSNEQNQTAGRD